MHPVYAKAPAWLDADATPEARFPPMMDLAADELETAAMACRMAANQAKRDGERQENPSMRALFARTEKRNRDLAARFEAERPLQLKQP